MRKLLVAALAAAAAAVPAASALAATRTVKVGDDYFVKRGTKPTITVRKGTTVRWKWVGKSTHNVRVTSGPKRFGSKFQTSGTFKRKLTRRGTYKLVCNVHPGSMRMTIRVR